MKIIAHIGSNAVMVEMTRDEVARCMGFAYGTSLTPTDRMGEPMAYKIGVEHNLSEIYHRLRSQEQIKDRMNSAASSLRALADLLETIKPIADEVNK